MLNQKLNASEKERDKLKQDYEEIILLREQEKKEISELRGKRPAVWKPEAGKDGNENLQAMSDKLALELQMNVEKYGALESKCGELRKKLAEANMELESAQNEKAYLKRQFAVTKRNLDKYMHENEIVMGRVHQAEQHRDAAVKETDQALALQLKATRELTKIKVNYHARLCWTDLNCSS